MTLAVRLWRELTTKGVRLAASGDGHLLFQGPSKVMTEERLAQLRNHKAEILELITGGEPMDALAREAGWLVLSSGEAYSFQVTEPMTVFLLRNVDDSWRIWRGSWRRGSAKPYKQDTVATSLPFDEALRRGNGHVQWLQDRLESGRNSSTGRGPPRGGSY